MTEEAKKSIFKSVDLHCESNNLEHRTSDVTDKELIVRRGQAFTLTLHLSQPFKPDLHPLTITAVIGSIPGENVGAYFTFSIPPKQPSLSEAAWKIVLKENSSPKTGKLCLEITPTANAPIAEYILTASHRGEETLLAMPVVLFNPWCPDDTVFLDDKKKRQEYVMNEQGIIYKGSTDYIFPTDWNYGQFEPDMVKICMKILDMSRKHQEDPKQDVSSRCDPIYVGRVVSAMINSEGDRGVLLGRWGGGYFGGFAPSHWDGSHAILKRWFDNDCRQVKYGQCWVFAGVMCSVMRLLGIPCRVVTNFNSAHDTNKNLTIDMYHADDGVPPRSSPDSVWNFHVWVEGWMKRPDLAQDGKYDGWQVLDPTPQEMSDGVYCCGPAPVKAIRRGHTDQDYDVPFVFAEVNADCVDWLLKADGTKVKISSDTKRVGKNISTKSVDSDKRVNITGLYKPQEGSKEEREVFKHALTRDFTRDEDWVEVVEDEGEEEVEMEVDEAEDLNENSTSTEGEGTNEVTPDVPPPPPPISMRFEEVSKPTNGKDVYLKLVVNSKSTGARLLSIMINAQVMNYNGSPVVNIMKEEKEETLQAGQDLSIPIMIPFFTYFKPMRECDNIKISVVVTDKENPENVYLAEDDVVLQDPPFKITTNSTEIKVNTRARAVVVFKNPVNMELHDCMLTISGSGLLKDEVTHKLPNLPPNRQFRCTIMFFPYKKGAKKLLVDFDCDVFRDIKASLNFKVTA